LSNGSTGTDLTNDPTDGHTHTADAWFAAHDFGLLRDAIKVFYGYPLIDNAPSAAKADFIEKL
jgi:hypothetical protein